MGLWCVTRAYSQLWTSCMYHDEIINVMGQIITLSSLKDLSTQHLIAIYNSHVSARVANTGSQSATGFGYTG